MNHFPFMTPKNDTLNQLFYERGQSIYIGPGRVESGFIYTPVDEGTKAFNLDVVGETRGQDLCVLYQRAGTAR